MTARRRGLMGLGALLFWVGAAGGQERVWVASAGTRLTAEPAATAKVVAEVAVGTELTVLATEGKWLRVAPGTRPSGWVYRGKVSATAPAPGGGLFGALPGSGIRVGAGDTARSIRGLSPEAEQYAQDAGTPKEVKAALDQVMALQVAEADLAAFLKAGRIGEYAP